MKLTNAKVNGYSLGEAYMLRRDGLEVWVDVHPYGVINRTDYARECNLLPAVFLAEHSSVNKQEAITFINSYLAEEVLSAPEEVFDTLTDPDKIRAYLLTALANKPSTFIQVLEWKGIVGDNKRNAQALVQYYKPEVFANSDEAYDVDIRDSGTLLAQALNQEFIRIRIGGEYESIGTGTYFARIGSTGFDWTSLIRSSFASHHAKRECDTICIERDEESDTGTPWKSTSRRVYRTADGKLIANLSAEEFLSSELPVLANRDFDAALGDTQKILMLDAAISNILRHTINPKRAQSWIRRAVDQERQLACEIDTRDYTDLYRKR